MIFFKSKVKVCGKPVSSRYISTIFPTAFTSFLSLCHIVVNAWNFQNLHQQKDWLVEGSDDG